MSRDLTNGPFKIVGLVPEGRSQYRLEIENASEVEVRDVRFQLVGNFPNDSLPNDPNHAIRAEFDPIESLQSGQKVLLRHTFYAGKRQGADATLLSLTDKGSFGKIFQLRIFFNNGDLQIIDLGKGSGLSRLPPANTKVL